MKKFLVAALLILSGCATQPTEAPVSRAVQPSLAGLSCAPKETIHRYLRWEHNAAVVDGEIVPKDEVWLIRTAGIASNDPQGLEYSMQIKSPDLQGVCCWFHPLMAKPGSRASTPKLAVEREFLLLPGERLGARTHAAMSDMALLYSGWRFPLACLPRLLGVERRSIDIDDK